MIINDCVLDLKRYWAPYGSVEPPAGWADDSRYGNDGVDTAMTWVQLPSGLWVKSFDGATSIVTIGDILSYIQTVIMWIAPDDITTRSIIDIDGGTHSIEIDGAGDITATGWAAPIIYVNGAVAAAVALSAWNCIAVTTTTSFAASAIVIGQEASFYLGKMGLPRIYTYALNADQINAKYASERHWFDGA